MPADLTRSPVPPPSPFAVGSREAARLLGVAERTLHAWRTEGRGPKCVREGRRILYAVAELHRWLAERGEGGGW